MSERLLLPQDRDPRSWRTLHPWGFQDTADSLAPVLL